MPLIATALAFVLRSVSIFLVVRVLFALGLGITTFVGGLALIETAETALLASYDGLPTTVAQLMAILKVDYAISVIFAGLTFRMTYGISATFGPRLPATGAGG